MSKTTEDWGESSDVEVIARLVDLKGKHLIDVGCGDGSLARALAERGATVLGVEADPQRAEANRALPESPGVTLVEGFAQNLPADDRSVDGVIFGKSLHHVPREDMAPALEEARRVIREKSGFLLVLEPLMEGSHSDLIRLFHDETEVRRWATDALEGLSSGPFAHEREIRYTVKIRFDDFDAFVAKYAGLTYNPYRLEDVSNEKVRAIFERGRDVEGYCFDQPMRVNLFDGVDNGAESR